MKASQKKREGRGMSTILLKSRLDPALEQDLLTQYNNLRADYLWLAKSRKVKSDYKDKFVAVKNKHVVYSGKSIYKMLEKIEKSGDKPESFAIHYVRKRPSCLLL